MIGEDTMMAKDTSQTDSLHYLQSADQLQLLDEIDKLRSHGISHYVSLPQLIVCGDQSSGKSSVLEAISGISFPTKDNLCTQFATEVILRKAVAVTISVAIVPSPTRSKDECGRIMGFRQTLENLSAFPELVDKAKDAMGVTGSANAFSNDVLRVEISGPDKPHLTIVDLPGLIHSENKLQSAADVTLVGEMVKRYMENRRSIILAVISAQNDYANQIVLKLAKGVDPSGRRTLGIITKPDTLHDRPESEMAFANLARNEDVEFRLGWHVLRNRDYRGRGTTKAERDRAETEFFSQGIWKDLPRAIVGIVTLRDRLSKVLLDQITAELPSLVEDIRSSLQDCQSKLAKLGVRRETIDEQRIFLLEISQSFQSLTEAAVDGIYSDPFFGSPRDLLGRNKRLRAGVQNLNLDFAQIMRLRGHNREIVESSASEESDLAPEIISRADFIEEIKSLLKHSRGRELPGMFNPLIVGELFREQSKKWEILAREHLGKMELLVRSFLEVTLSHLADENTFEAILREVVGPSIDEKLRKAGEKLDELLEPHQKGHPITYNHYFTENIQNMRRKFLENDLRGRLGKHFGSARVTISQAEIQPLASSLASLNVADADDFACSEILLGAEAYYKVSWNMQFFLLVTEAKSYEKVALKSFVDNVAILVIEACLMKDLRAVFSPVLIMQMNGTSIQKIAAESQENQDQREMLSRKKAVLSSGLEICQRYVRRSTLGKSKPFLGLGSCHIIFHLIVLADIVQREWRLRSNRGQEAQYQSKLKAPMREMLQRHRFLLFAQWLPMPSRSCLHTLATYSNAYSIQIFRRSSAESGCGLG